MNVFIVGAGASASLSPRVPVMNNFFRLAAERITVEKKEYWFPFTFTDRARLFSKNVELERLADEILLLNSEIEDMENKNNHVPRQLKDHLDEFIQEYRSGFLADQHRAASNLESLFDKFLEHATVTEDDESLLRFRYLISALFYDLSRELVFEFKESAYMYLAEFLKEKKKKENIFISFNYETWLEQALTHHQLFDPLTGYSKYAPFSYCLDVDSLPGDDLAIELRPIKPIGESMYVLKPNGSLSWWLADWSYAGDNEAPRRQLFVSLSSDGKVAQYRAPHIMNIAEPGSRSLLAFAQPHIYPPTVLKARNVELDWNIDRQILETLSEASTFIIVGWSMPDGDVHFFNLLREALIERMKAGCQPPRLIICDLVTEGSDARFRYLKYRLASSFRAIHVVDWPKGFSKQFVDFLSRYLN